MVGYYSLDSDFKFVAMMQNQVTYDQANNTGNVDLYLDSGSPEHLTDNLQILSNVVNLDVPRVLDVANKNCDNLVVHQKESLNVFTNYKIPGTFQNVYYCPDVQCSCCL